MEVVKLLTKTQQALSIDQPKKITGLLPQEQMIYELKRKSKPVTFMSAQELKLSVNNILIKINIITGWTFPSGGSDKETISYQKILRDQFEKKLIESYPNVNMDEIEYAFRNYPVKDWGKNINLNLIDEVMQPYLNDRREVSRMEETKVKELPGSIVDTDPFTDEERIATDKFMYNTTKNLRAITQKVAAILFKEGKIEKPNEEDSAAIEKQAISLLHQELFSEKRVLMSYDSKEKEIKKIMNQILVAKYFNEKQTT